MPNADGVARKDQLCQNCGHVGVRAKGLCGSCYNVEHGVPTKAEVIAARKVEAALDNVASRMLDANSPLLTVEDMERMAQAAADAPPTAAMLGLYEEGEPSGVTKARGYLTSQAAYFRRKIIRQMMGNGMSEPNDIFLAFFRDPELRKRWIEPLADPWRIFQMDISKINTERSKPKPVAQRRNLRIERLESQFRIAMSVANDLSSKSEVRLKALETADRLQGKLDTMERTINPKPGRGDLLTPETEGDDNTYGAPEEDDDRRFTLPHIE